MMEFTPFMVTLMAVSVLTGLFTEAIKKQLDELNKVFPQNLMAGIVSVILSVMVFAGEMIHLGLSMNPDLMVYLVALIMGSWLCAMIGFDKVKQAISQIGA